MKFVSFNINGLRARPHQLAALVETHQPDIIGLQETKVHDDMFPLEEVQKLGYHVFFHGQKGHYGVALMTKMEPVSVQRGFITDEDDAQRRIIMAEIPSAIGNITVINGYFPQGESRDHPLKFPAKEKFYRDLQDHLESRLDPQQPVLIMGDMNISCTDNDIGIGDDNRKRWLRTGKCSFLPEEREWMDKLLGWGSPIHGVPPGLKPMIASPGLITVLKGSMITAVCVSIYCWQASLWPLVAWRPVSIMISAVWRNRQITPRCGRPLTSEF
ncbi:Exodeoxyribonuclease III [Tatumella ptyseos]|uniref:Exodeoxyribonuclease III n=1 Tax=Tatumella ptyseos TaxID=82987 RepID=A0A2X5PA72_9GAMM|nr:Exodeoxyribonuclease III [Tatumella ptyseos]